MTIEVSIKKQPENIELARILIRRVENRNDIADYSIRFAVERGMAVGVHRRGIFQFPRKSYNVLALVLQALNTLDPKELELEDDFDPDSAEANRKPNLARRLGRSRPEV